MNLPEAISRVFAQNPLWVVDIGASGGISPIWSQLGKNFKALLFEPDPREFAEMQKRLGGENYLLFNTALSDAQRTLDLYLCKKQQVSSVYPPNLEYLKRFPGWERFEVERVVQLQADTLDHVLGEENASRVDFIKIDVQGHEIPVLSAAKQTLASAIGVESEASLAPIYKGMPEYDLHHPLFKEAGMELMDIRRTYWKRTGASRLHSNKGQLAFVDLLYFKSPETLIEQGAEAPKLLRAAMIFLTYGYIDLAETLIKLAQDTRRIGAAEARSFQPLLDEALKGRFFHFRGKGRVQIFFDNLAKRFAFGDYAGTDRHLGSKS